MKFYQIDRSDVLYYVTDYSNQIIFYEGDKPLYFKSEEEALGYIESHIEPNEDFDYLIKPAYNAKDVTK